MESGKMNATHTNISHCRLGKREDVDLDRATLQRLLCEDYGLDCDLSIARSTERELPLGALLRRLASTENRRQHQQPARYFPRSNTLDGYYSDDQAQVKELDLMDLMSERLRRETRALDENPLSETASRGNGAKRVAFTPRIGRR